MLLIAFPTFGGMSDGANQDLEETNEHCKETQFCYSDYLVGVNIQQLVRF